MRFIDINNSHVLDILERFRYLYRDKYDITKTNKHIGDKSNREYYTSEEYMRKVISWGKEHRGFPHTAYSYPIKPEHYDGDDPQYESDYNDIDYRMKRDVGFNSSALTQLYPPGGFIDWHNNANSTTYNILFTWNETGDGWFKWYDMKKDEVVTMPDKKGWSAKVGYYPSYGESEPPLYHCASTDSWRITMAYTVPPNEKGRDYWLDMIDYIQCED